MERRTSHNLALPLIFFNLLQWNLSKFLQFVKVVQPIIQKPKKKVLQRQFPHFLQFCVFFLHLKFGLINFFLSTGNMFNGPENLRKFHQRKCDKSYSKDPYFLCCQILHNRIELHQDQYLFMHRLLNLSPSGNLSTVFSFQLTSFSEESLWILQVKFVETLDSITKRTVLCWTVFNTPFQVMIMQLYQGAMFVLHVDT